MWLWILSALIIVLAWAAWLFFGPAFGVTIAVPVVVTAVVVLAVAAFQVNELRGLRATSVYPDRALIPAGSCVVSDEISLAIAANRFTAARPGRRSWLSRFCPKGEWPGSPLVPA